MNDFASVFRKQLKVTGKSLSFVAEYSGLDRAYVSRLASGAKVNPSPETVCRLYMALIADEALLRQNVGLTHGLADLLLAARFGAVARSS